MYTIIEAIGVRKGINKRWEVIDMSAWTVQDLLSTFRKVQVELLPAGATSNVFLDLIELAPTYATYADTLATILTSIGSETLPTTMTGIVLNQRHALQCDAFKAGYTVTPVNALNVIDTSVENSSLPNIRLTRTDTTMDYSYMFNRCLVTINGFYHRTDTDGENGLMVVGAMTSRNISGSNQIGLLSFASMCAIEILPIASSMIDTTTADKPIINLGVDLTDKSVLLILGGYMVQVDGTALKRVGDASYKIDLTQLNLVDRYYESSNYIDLTELEISTSANNTSEISISDLTTESVTKAWLQLSQTFFVILDTPDLYLEKQYVARSGMPDIYFNYSKPESPLVLELGRHPSYWMTYEDNVWRMTLYDNVIGNTLYYSKPLPTWINTSGSNMSGMPTHLSEAYLLEIGRDY